MSSTQESKSKDLKNTKLIRPLGQNESYELAIQVLDHRRGVVLVGRYSVPQVLASSDQQEQLHEALELAIANTVLEHPLLQVALAHEDSKKPLWVQLDKIDLRKLVKWQPAAPGTNYDAYINETTTSLLNYQFEDLNTLPAWRVVILSDESKPGTIDVVFVFNHAAMDGRSSNIFHDTLLEKLNRNASADGASACPSLVEHIIALPSPPKTLPKPQEQLCNFPMDASMVSKAVVGLVWPSFERPKQFWATWAPVLHVPCQNQSRVISIDHATLQNLLTTCRAHKSTLTGLFHAILLASFSSRLKESEAVAFAALTALDTRWLLPTTPDFTPVKTIANYVSNTEHDFDKKLVGKIRTATSSASLTTPELDELVWSAAATVRADIQKKLDLGRKGDKIALMKLIPDWRAYAKNNVAKPRQLAWGVSNLGVVDGMPADENSAWSLDRAIFAASACVGGPAFQINSISVKGKDLCVNCSWQEGVLRDGLGDQVCIDVEAWLRHLGGQK